MNQGVNDAMLELRALERRYARSVASSIDGLLAGTTTAATTHHGPPLATWRRLNPPDGYLNVAPDRYGRRWMLARGLNFGECNLCHIGRSESSRCRGRKDGNAHIEDGMCRTCAIVDLEDAEALRLVILEAQAVLASAEPTRGAEVSRLFLGFAPLTLAERSDAA